MNALDFKALPFSSKARICWGFLWRGLATTIGSALCGGVLGGIIGFLFGMLRMPKGGAIVAGIFGLFCGFFFFYLFVRWLLTSRIGNYRLVLIDAQDKI